jgi:hypothetical protein
MFLEILDLIIGLIFIFFVLSIAASSAVETISRWQNIRANNLEKWMLDSFDEKIGEKTFGQLINEHSLIQKLTTKGRIPSYIPSKIFSQVLLDIIHSQENTELKTYSPTRLKEAIEKTALLPEDLKRSFLQKMEDTNDDLESLKTEISDWFDLSMQRIGGTYKKFAQRAIWIISLTLAISLNVDTFQLSEFLYENPEARNNLVLASQNAISDSTYIEIVNKKANTDSTINVSEEIASVKKQIENISSIQASFIDQKLPIGWPVKNQAMLSCETSFWTLVGLWLKKFGGWLITGLAVSMGAPFWFETLNKLVNLRGAGANPSKTKSNPNKTE